MPGFVQIMEFDTSKIEEVTTLAERLRKERGDAFPVTKATVTADRDRPGHYFVIVEFDSYEDAMENSNSAATTKYSEEMRTLLDGPPTFHNLDVHSVMTG